MNNNFKSHLSKIKLAKKRTTEIFSDLGISNKVAVASLYRAWEMLFDSLCTTNDGSIGELKDISSVIQKLSMSQQKIQDAELKNLKRIESAELNKEKEKLELEYANLHKKNLPHEIINIVEEQLSLL